MRARFQLRLSHKIMIIAAIGIAGMLAFGAIYQFGSRMQDASRAVAESVRSISELNEKLSVELLRRVGPKRISSCGETRATRSVMPSCRLRSAATWIN